MANHSPTGTLKISGKYAAGETLTVSKGTLADADVLGALTYKWIDTVTGTVLSSTDKLTLSSSAIGKAINVVATYTDGGSTVETSTVYNILANKQHTGTVSITGTPLVGTTITAKNDIKDGDGLGTVTYSWTNADTGVVLGSGATYKVKAADAGHKITATAQYTDKSGYLESESNTTASVAAYSTKTSAADDILSGTQKSDKLTGGLGTDTFKFNDFTLSNLLDKITDFNHSQGDKIDLSGIDADVGSVGDSAFTFGAKPSDATVSAAGKLWFDADTNTLSGSIDFDLDAEFSIQLIGVTVFDATDTIL